MTYNYPVLKKYPVLLPVLWIDRLVKALIEKPDKVWLQLKAVFRPIENQKEK